jgi:hypothetical protein
MMIINASGWEGHKWAQPNVTHLGLLLLRIHNNNRTEAWELGQQARSNIVEKYSLNAMANIMRAELNRIIVSKFHKKPLDG